MTALTPYIKAHTMEEECILEYEEALTGSPFKQHAMGEGGTLGNGFSSVSPK
jgi:hypothetical protein